MAAFTGFLTTIKIKFEELLRRRLLKKYGYSDWETYLRIEDPDINYSAPNVTAFYSGYTNVHVFTDRKHDIYHWDVMASGKILVEEWCKEHCKHKFRIDWHRVSLESDIWEYNELFGGDYLAIAFKDDKDFTWFMLNWP